MCILSSVAALRRVDVSCYPRSDEETAWRVLLGIWRGQSCERRWESGEKSGERSTAQKGGSAACDEAEAGAEQTSSRQSRVSMQSPEKIVEETRGR